ncbi:hypothetical protein ABPG74_011941 [Tetrahymena malaccensis]
MDNQSYNNIPLAINQNNTDMSIQMVNPSMIHHVPQNQNQMYAPQMMQQQLPNQYQHQQMMMQHPQMIQQQYPLIQQQQQQKPIFLYSATPQQPSSRYSQPLYCSNCQRVVPSLVEFQAGKGAWVSGLVIGLLGCWAGCCLIPCCNEDFQDAVHQCTICHQQLGKKQFLFD